MLAMASKYHVQSALVFAPIFAPILAPVFTAIFAPVIRIRACSAT
jgi:hypothetical protein